MTRNLFFALLALCACHSAPQEITVTYQETTEDFPNPERGFYHPSNAFSSAYKPLSDSVLKGYRTPTRKGKATYEVVSTLVYRDFVMDKFKDKPLDDSLLNNIRSDFNAARLAGVKLIPRFTYIVKSHDGKCPDGFICPPYGDAPKNIVLGHIGQLKPILQENADVTAFVQMGFIGIWGENYYTDYFGDASANTKEKRLLDQHWQDRIDVLKAILDAVPKEIMVQVRTPQMKQRYVYGIQAPVTADPLTESEAFTETDKARIGFHNDCFISSVDDYGTFDDFGNSATPHKSENNFLRKYFAADSRYVVVGGETCSDDYSPQNDCGPAGIAEEEMKNLHYTYLNTSYNNDVNNDWVSGGCMESIKRNLGYRFVLKNGVYPSAASRSDSLKVKLTLENVGYTSPVNARPVELILRNVADKTIHTITFNTDIRKWYSGEITLEENVVVDKISSGTYELLLNLPDSHSSLSKRPEYSIRLANNMVWEESSGYNNLNHKIEIR